MPQTRLKGHARRRRVFGIVVCLLILAAIINYARPIPAIAARHIPPTLAVTTTIPLSWPTSGEATIGAVGYGVLSSEGTQTPQPTASVAKLITALAVLQKYPVTLNDPGPTITLTAADVALYQQYVAEDGSAVAVQAGEQINEYQVLQAMMLPSANNMADSLAIWAFGSLSAYATYANQLVTTLGLTQTHVGSDASGFLPDTTSTSQDLVRLGIDVLKNPVLAQIVDQRSAIIPVAGTIYNVNSLLDSDGIVGIKTGNSDQAGGVYLFAAQDPLDSTHSVTIVGAVEGLADLKSALSSAIPLLTSAKQNVSLSTILRADQVVGVYETPWKTTVNAVAQTDLQSIAWNGLTPKPTLDLEHIKPNKAADTVVGHATMSSGSGTASTAIVLKNSLPAAPVLWRLTRHNF
jgi:D-alanyl-D-alanine carboxypeptidase (penicillin-binding protein 5/6)